MSIFRHWKMILGLAAIFAAGFGTGVISVVLLVHRTITHPVQIKVWTEARLGELERHLKLTPEQKEKVRPIIEKAGNRIRSIVANGLAEVVETEREAYDELIKELTPEQQKELEKRRDEIRKRLRDLVNRETGKLARKGP